jgi:hypothetical protein
LIIVPALCFPAVKGKDLTLLTMNWTCLIYGGAMTLAMSWYMIDARRWFKGPRINIAIHEGTEPDTFDRTSTDSSRKSKSGMVEKSDT